MALISLQGNYTYGDVKSVYRPLIHAYGNDILEPIGGSPSWRFVFDVYINGVFIVREYKAKIYANVLTTGDGQPYAWIDVSNILKNYAAFTFKKGAYPSYINYQVKCGYENLGVLYPALYTDNSLAWFGYPSFSKDDLHDDIGLVSIVPYQPFVLSTNRYRTINTYGNYSVFIPIHKSQSFYNSVISWGYTPGNYPFMDSLLEIGTYNCEFNNTNLLYSDNEIYIDVDGELLQNTNSGQFFINNVCTKNNPVMLHFLNQLGGIESFLFDAVNRESATIERNSYGKLGLTAQQSIYSSGGDIYGNINQLRKVNDVISETKINYNNVMTYKMKLVSDFISETDFTWLRQLLSSSMVYMQMNDETTFIPITIETSDWMQKFNGVDKVFNMEIDITFGKQQTQLR
jgi:hypothetical protein